VGSGEGIGSRVCAAVGIGGAVSPGATPGQGAVPAGGACMVGMGTVGIATVFPGALSLVILRFQSPQAIVDNIRAMINSRPIQDRFNDPSTMDGYPSRIPEDYNLAAVGL
jgi:hypothetical protein